MNALLVGVVVVLIVLVIGFTMRQRKEGWRPRQMWSDTAHDNRYDWEYHQRVPNEGPQDYKSWEEIFPLLKEYRTDKPITFP